MSDQCKSRKNDEFHPSCLEDNLEHVRCSLSPFLLFGMRK